MNLRFSLSASLFLALLACTEKQTKVDFNSQIKPIINKKCITCHGGVKRNADFSLLFREEALDTAESGKLPIIPGDPDHSELLRRIQLTDPEERMPYKEKPLAKEEIDLLRQWIKEGAPWGRHWAYRPVVTPELPEQPSFLSGLWPTSSQGGNEIDLFVNAKLKELEWEANDPADPAVRLRRVYLDIIGLPPTPEEANAFLNDPTRENYEKIVDQLLASPRFGEKWASWWLDMARYADTKGYERDVYRNIWRYRDYVIRAFNSDMPFDQFTIEQLAGDLLPHPTEDQFIATGFHRNTMNNDEGGTEDEEFRVAAIIDRVNTTMEVWQSTTFGCVQCHSHPYDPFRHEEYYKVMAFFNNTRDEDTEGEHPNLRFYEEKDQQKVDELLNWMTQQKGASSHDKVEKFVRLTEPKYHPHVFDQFVNGELIDTKWLGIRPGGSARIKGIDLTGKSFMLFHYRTGDTGGTLQVRRDDLKGEVIVNVQLDSSRRRKTIAIPLKPVQGSHDLYFIFSNPRIHPDKAVADVEWIAFQEDDFNDPVQFQRYLELLNAKVDNTPVMVENDSSQMRATFVFERGNWLVHGKEEKPAVPAYLNPLPAGAPLNRLGFAQWLMSQDNPLTARTVVNRVWEQLFGSGLVETLEDFGTQGATPSHPALLDWLSSQLMNEYKWSLKKLIKEMVMSETYGRDSHSTSDQREKDPTNKWLARGPSFRLTGEQLRDQALAVSGLLSDKMYGKSVMPLQPEGVWQTVYSDEKWTLSTGEDRHRRSVYTFQKRTSPYPSMITFDGSSREVCQVRRIRTNTPLQSLVTLNDPVYLEAADALAERMIASSTSIDDQIRDGYRRLMFMDMSEDKLKSLRKLYDSSLASFLKNQPDGKGVELQAMQLVASALLNLDEVIVKQ